MSRAEEFIAKASLLGIHYSENACNQLRLIGKSGINLASFKKKYLDTAKTDARDVDIISSGLIKYIAENKKKIKDWHYQVIRYSIDLSAINSKFPKEEHCKEVTQALYYCETNEVDSLYVLVSANMRMEILPDTQIRLYDSMLGTESDVWTELGILLNSGKSIMGLKLVYTALANHRVYFHDSVRLSNIEDVISIDAKEKLAYIKTVDGKLQLYNLDTKERFNIERSKTWKSKWIRLK